VNGGHGRIEKRSVRVSSDIDWLKACHPGWKGLRTIVAVSAQRECGGKMGEETRYFISSLDASDPKRLGLVVRSHWGIKNNLHWVLDYAFDEGNQRSRKGNFAANMAVIRHIALNLIKADKQSKIGIKNRRIKAGWDNDYLMSLLMGKA